MLLLLTLFCLLPLGDILDTAEELDHVSGFILHRAYPDVQILCDAAGERGIDVEIRVLPLLHSDAREFPHAFDFRRGVVAGLFSLRRRAERLVALVYFIGLSGPFNRMGGGVRFPTANLAQILSILQALLALLQ